MAIEKSVKIVQVIAATLGIPAAAAGSYSAYKSYFLNEDTCLRLKASILVTLDKNLPADTKHSLLRTDVSEFDKLCGKIDPEARTIFDAAMHDTAPAPGATPVAAATTVAAATAPAAAPPSTAAPARKHLGLFGAAGSADQQGWVALSRKDGGAWVVNFSGYAISETSLPPPGTVLTAERLVPVWSEVQIGSNDPSKLRSQLPGRACVRVLTTRIAASRLWAEVAPAACS
jgi:hypothetical protein